MRRFAFTWVIIALAAMLLLVFLIAQPAAIKEPITGRLALDNIPSSPRQLPVYTSTLIILLVVIVFFVLIVAGFSHHSRKDRIEEKDSIKKLLRR